MSRGSTSPYCADICGFRILVRGAGPELLARFEHYRSTFPFTKPTNDFILVLSDNLLQVNADDYSWLPSGKTCWQPCVDGSNCRVSKAEDGALKSLLYVSHDCRQAKIIINEMALGTLSSTELQYQATRDAWLYFLSSQDALAIHASGISLNGEGIAFCGHSGIGKSTHVGHWTSIFESEVTVLNDDLPVVRTDLDNAMFGSPWSGKTTLNCPQSAPLRALVFLEQATETSLEQLDSAQAYLRLVQNVFRPSFSEEYSKNMLSRIETLVLSVPSFRLKCDNRETSARIARESLSAAGVIR